MKQSTQKMKMMMAGGAVASAAAAANGAIVYHNPADVTISGRTEQRAYLDLTSGTITSTEQSGVSDLVFIVGANGTSKPYTYLDQVAGSSGALVTSSSNPSFLLTSPSDTLINAASLSHAYYQDGGIALVSTGTSYLGFSFVESGTTMYGWLRAEFVMNTGEAGNGDDFNTITVYDWAYETSGEPIMTGAGAVPEPSSAAMMAVLAGSAALYRRRARKDVAA